MEDHKTDSMDWAFWFYWIMATTLGWLTGNFITSAMPVVISGVAIAAFQWSVLYKRIHAAWRWLLLSSLGWVVGYILFVIFFSANLKILFGVVIGGTLGIFQWSILRKEFNLAGWWIIISTLAWTTGLTFMPGILTSGTLPGTLTGLVLVIFFRFSSRQALGASQTKH